MTRSSRRANRIAGRSKYVESDVTCEECGAPTVLLRGTTHACKRCGLVQERGIPEQDPGPPGCG